MFHTSQIEISKSALKFNLDFIYNYLGEGVTFSSVVKGNAYGHGIDTFVPLAYEFGVKHFSVFSANEAFEVKRVVPEASIMIMGLVDEEQLRWAIENDVEFYVFDFERLNNAVDFAKKIRKKAKIHLEVETGMNRTGFCPKEIKQVLGILAKEQEYVEFKGLCTHFAGAESIANYYRMKKQQSNFKKIVSTIENSGLQPEKYHTACSAASLRYPKTQMDMVRIGIMQYGFFPNREMLIDYITKKKKQEYPLRRLISWKSKVMDVKYVKAGEFVGYGTSYLANDNIKIATVPIGYGHGFTRSLSNRGRVLIGGKRLGVIGIVNMNLITVDVSALEHVKKGDEVVIIGNQGGLELSVSSFSENTEQVNYELLTRLPQDIPRIIVE